MVSGGFWEGGSLWAGGGRMRSDFWVERAPGPVVGKALDSA